MKSPAFPLKKAFAKKAFAVCCGLVFVAGFALSAQTARIGTTQNRTRFGNELDRSLKITIGGGGVSYVGDLSDQVGRNLNLMFGGGLLYKFAPHVSLKGEFSFYRLSGSDAGTKNAARNLSFESQNVEAYAGIMYEMFDVENPSRGRGLIVNPYAFAGLGFTTFSPQAQLDGVRYNLRRYRTEDVAYSTATVIAPVGLGIRFEFTRRLGMSIEGGYRFTFSDYLDDVSTTYIGSANITDNIRARLADRGPEVGTPLSEAGAQRGNPNRKDGYVTLGIKLEYLLWPFNKSGKPQCPASTQISRKPIIKR